MTGERSGGSGTEVAILLLYDAAEMLNDHPSSALRRDGVWTSLSLAADIERLLNDLRIRYNAVLSALSDLT